MSSKVCCDEIKVSSLNWYNTVIRIESKSIETICKYADRVFDEWIVYNGYEPIIIATKLDKIKRSQHAKHIKAIKEGLGVKPGTIILPFSAQSKQGRDEILDLIEELTTDTPTGE